MKYHDPLMRAWLDYERTKRRDDAERFCRLVDEKYDGNPPVTTWVDLYEELQNL